MIRANVHHVILVRWEPPQEDGAEKPKILVLPDKRPSEIFKVIDAGLQCTYVCNDSLVVINGYPKQIEWNGVTYFIVKETEVVAFVQ